jgi:L-fucose mutarotase
MLKGIDPLLTPELLKVLAEMGHGDEIIIADANFTAASLSVGADGQRKPLIHLPGAGVLRAAQPVAYMHVSDTPAGYRSRLQRDVVAMLAAQGHAQSAQCEAVERFAFYDRVRQAFAIVLTSDLQPYGNFLFKKGVLGEPLDA